MLKIDLQRVADSRVAQALRELAQDGVSFNFLKEVVQLTSKQHREAFKSVAARLKEILPNDSGTEILNNIDCLWGTGNLAEAKQLAKANFKSLNYLVTVHFIRSMNRNLSGEECAIARELCDLLEGALAFIMNGLGVFSETDDFPPAEIQVAIMSSNSLLPN